MDYKSTLNLPKTGFSMKADLAKKEPEILASWDNAGLYEKIRETPKANGKYTLHDGPPYANGNIHIGHALNKILKDIIVKSRFMMGYSTDFVPGWDCHGLPIELQAEKELGKTKDSASKLEIRKRCRSYAQRFVEIQREEFKRLGVLGCWDKPYLTMSYDYEAAILSELGKFHKKGLVYKGKKPVHWCASCKTALAEAEVEYEEKLAPSVYVKFQVTNDPKKVLKEFPQSRHFFVIWTTTPWTLPANLAIAVHPDISYSAIEVKPKDGKSDEIWIAHSGLQTKINELFGAEVKRGAIGGELKGKQLEGIICKHPFIERESKIILGGHVTVEAGTGCVHIAPGHGADDYELGLKYGLDIYAPVDDAGKFTKDVSEFEGQFVFKANDGIMELLKTKDALVYSETITHSYPHCWRCKKPIIFRATEQWFISMEKENLRARALKAIDEVTWIPSWGRDRIYNMVQNRPDWCISRQRSWGVPIPALRCKGCRTSFLDDNLMERLTSVFEKEGADAWFERELKDILPEGVRCPKCANAEFEKEEDILDVWFDSGVSFSAVLEKRDNLNSPADLYLEGSDQHRGWFQSSLIASIGTRNAPPYKSVLTHGFVVDGSGKKMSKSTGNVIAPQEVMEKYGGELLRLWVCAEDYRDDVRISPEILERLSEAYRRIRNTIRFLLGNLYDFAVEKDEVSYGELKEIDRLMLHRLSVLADGIIAAYKNFEFHAIYHAVHNYATIDLSSFYLDVIKDRLYTAHAQSKERRSAQTVLHHTLVYLLKLLAPVLVFTTDEAWGFLPGKKTLSAHLSEFPKPRKDWIDDELEKKWEKIMAVKIEISKALEGARQGKIIGHSLDAKVIIFPAEELCGLVEDEMTTLKDILIISQIETGPAQRELKITVEKAPGKKCERCWHISPAVGEDKTHPTICKRCIDALSL